jgi:hypothetical protein
MVIPNNLLEVERDDAEEPRHDDAVHMPLVGVVWSAVSVRTWSQRENFLRTWSI